MLHHQRPDRGCTGGSRPARDTSRFPARAFLSVQRDLADGSREAFTRSAQRLPPHGRWLPGVRLLTPPRYIVAAMQPRTSSQKPAATTTLFPWKSPRTRTEASAVVDSTIADTSTSPRMTRTMVLMFMARAYTLRHAPQARARCPPPGDIAWLHDTAFRLFPDSPYAKVHQD